MINLIFYFVFGTSDESEESIEIDDKNQLSVEDGMTLEQEITNSVTP